MSSGAFLSPPTAIGGLGGSGTRVFATMLAHAGHHIGDTLNTPLDNLWFTVLFKQAAWTRSPPDPDAIATATRLFVQAMTTGLLGQISDRDRALILRLRAELPPDGPWRPGAQAAHADALLASTGAAAPRPWGWKEPNTHVFLPHLDRLIPGFRYIHVVRDPLDMAFSSNKWQTRHWGHLYGVADDPDTPLPLRQLRYWVAANRAALDYGRTHMPGRFLAVSYDAFCAEPPLHWARIRPLTNAPADLELPHDLVHPTTIGRSRAHDLSIFPTDLLEAARALQSDVENPVALG